jgi:hypothetical protein
MNFELYQDFFKKSKKLIGEIQQTNNKINVFALPAIPNKQQDFITSADSIIYHGDEINNTNINLVIPSSVEYMQFIPEEMNNIPIGVYVKNINRIGRSISSEYFLFKKDRYFVNMFVQPNGFIVSSFIYDNIVINQQ